MDWIRRNWPDLLIGVALIAVIAGIIVTLLGGGSPFDLVGGQRSAPQVQRPPVSAPAPDEVESPLSALRSEEAELVGEEVIPVVPLLEGEQVEASDPPATEQVTTQEPTTQTAQTTQQPTTREPVTPPTTQEPVVQPIPPAEATQQTTTPPQQTATTTPSTPATTTGASDATSTSWRIAVGSFRQRDGAERTAQQYRDEGYPVFIAQQDDLNIVLLGPYDDEAAAQSLAQQLRSAGRDARLYVYRPPTSETATTTTPPASTSTPPATTTATATPQTQAPATTQTPPAQQAPQAQAPTTTQSPGTVNRYVQVGAYTTAESAQPQRQRVEALGYQVTTRTTDTGVIRLWVGPFTDSEAQAVSQRLGAQGIENFVLTSN